ncbi:hypothetical protein [Tabrizicola oligotrophica]|uniref:Uncharacterized protein n=1 Tax=Tabrizicola oligotrophica TaxID=2710650 RepID=A0A6M0QX18_9RHOB|nr:hypothetical protein [Tabrizicola oligotrophica]NEY91927.1 hypothetical protein [Tabrizicola oligotrophica]
MKSFLTATALSLLAVTAAQASGNAAPTGVELRPVELTNARDIADNGSSSITVTIGAPKEVSATLLPPRDRVEAGYKADSTVTLSAFPGAPTAVHSRH